MRYTFVRSHDYDQNDYDLHKEHLRQKYLSPFTLKCKIDSR